MKPFRPLRSAATVALLVLGFALAAVVPASADHLGESAITISVAPGTSVVYPTKMGVYVEVRDVSSSCEAVVFPSCDEPQGWITIFIDGVDRGNWALDKPQYSQYDDRSWTSIELPILDAGVHQLVVRYQGDFTDATSSATLNIAKGDCTLRLDQDKAQTVEGEPVTFHVETPFEPGDLLEFFDANSRQLGEVPIAWDGWITWGAWWTTSALPVGTTEVHAFYWGPNYNPCISNFVNHTVAPRNTAPVAADDASYTLLGQQVTVDVLANDNDAEGGALSVSIATPPANGQATVNAGGTITYTPNPGYVGPLDTFDYRVTDSSGLSDTGTVSVIVVCLIERPDSYAVGYNVPLVVAAPGVLANDEHACDPGRGVWVADPPAHGTVDLRPDGGFTYTPGPNYSGTDTFTYVFMNTLVQAPKATVTLTVAAPPPNRAPTATDAAIAVLEGRSAAVPLAATDPDNDVLSYTVTGVPAHGTLSGTAPNLTYTPAAGYVGPDSFQFTVSDGRGGSDGGTVAITVTAAQRVATQVTGLGGTRVVGARGDSSYENLSARLTRSDTGAGLPGQTVSFMVDGTAVCTAVTSATGNAACSAGPFARAALSPPVNYTASYAGDGLNLLPSSGTGTLRTRKG